MISFRRVSTATEEIPSLAPRTLAPTAAIRVASPRAIVHRREG